MTDSRIKTVIVDDDKSILITLRHLLESRHSEMVEILGTANSVKSGVELIQEHKPELAFLDINLPDGESFDILDELQDHNLNLDVIFITAHDQYALKAFDFAALDYIMKPFDPEDIANALERVRKLNKVRALPEKVDVYRKAQQKSFNRIIIPSSDGLTITDIDKIIRLEASDTYTFFYMKDGSKILASKSLSNFERILEDLHFQRIHSKHLINLKYIQKYQKGKGGSVIMLDGSEVEVSVRKKTDFMNALKEYARSV